ncbi:MAG: hypothetical protein ABF260_07715 [Flavobacteriaceae bacterium]
MRKEYKKIVIEWLYALTEGSAKGLEDAIADDLSFGYHIKPDVLNVTSTDKYIADEQGFKLWIGTMTVLLVIGENKFTISRDWEEEYLNDKQHPDYIKDENFYASKKVYSSIKCRELLKKLELES